MPRLVQGAERIRTEAETVGQFLTPSQVLAVVGCELFGWSLGPLQRPQVERRARLHGAVSAFEALCTANGTSSDEVRGLVEEFPQE
jgi:hypothetical protein